MILIMYDNLHFEPQPNRMTESLSHKKRSVILIPRRIISEKKTSKNESQTPTRWAPTSYKWSHNPYKWPYEW